MKTDESNSAVLSEPQPAEPWLKTPAACKHLSISVPTLRRWVKAKRIVPRRTPTGEFRFRREDLDALLA
jgi:excisionase family DNA binding protein